MRKVNLLLVLAGIQTLRHRLGLPFTPVFFRSIFALSVPAVHRHLPIAVLRASANISYWFFTDLSLKYQSRKGTTHGLGLLSCRPSFPNTCRLHPYISTDNSHHANHRPEILCEVYCLWFRYHRCNRKYHLFHLNLINLSGSWHYCHHRPFGADIHSFYPAEKIKGIKLRDIK